MHPALTDPKINAPQWPLFRLLAIAGIGYMVYSGLSRFSRSLNQGGIAILVNSVATLLLVALVVVVVATALAVRKLRALEARVPPASEHRVLFPTFGFSATGARLMAVEHFETSPRGLWGWMLVEVTPEGVQVHGHPQRAELTRSITASQIIDIAPGAITDSIWRVPTLNLAVQSPSGVIGVPIGLLRHPLAFMRADERDATLQRVRGLLGVPRGSSR